MSLGSRCLSPLALSNNYALYIKKNKQTINDFEGILSEEVIDAGVDRCILSNSDIKNCIYTLDITWHLVNICRFYIFIYQLKNLKGL